MCIYIYIRFSIYIYILTGKSASVEKMKLVCKAMDLNLEQVDCDPETVFHQQSSNFWHPMLNS